MLKSIINAIVDVTVTTIAFVLLGGIFFLSGAALIAWEDSWARMFMWVVNVLTLMAMHTIVNKQFDILEEEEEDEEES